MKIIASNNRANYNFTISNKFEVGIVLTGSEVKSLRLNTGSIRTSYIIEKEGELWLANSFIKILRDNAKALTASRLANQLKEKVIAITGSHNIKQTPEFSNMHKAGHDGGDFLFVPSQLVHP